MERSLTMGFHPIELIVIAVIVLALLGPKALQSIARDAGKGMNQVKNLKNKALAELPMEEISKVSSQIPRIPTHPHDVVQMLMGPETQEKKQEAKPE